MAIYPPAAQPRYAPPASHPTQTLSQCEYALRSEQVGFAALPNQNFGGGCSQIDAVRITALHDDEGALPITSIGPTTCQLAETIENWTRYGVDRAARQTLGSPIARVETFGSYNCRNVAGTSHRSGHATANAVDISGFVLADGRRITIKSNWYGSNPQERLFLRQIRQSACKRFGMVLSPDYNSAHEDHLHLEIGVSHVSCH